MVAKRSTPLSNFPLMTYGNMPLEGGHLRFSDEERRTFLTKEPWIERYIRPVVGGDEFLKNLQRFCFWIENDELSEALRSETIKERIELVKKFRISGGEVASTLVSRSHQFR